VSAHRGPDAPAQPRTLRGTALEKASPSSFPEDVPFDHTAGVPADQAGGRYDSNVPNGGTVPSPGNSNPKPISGK
jgi:hypothetical protein